MFSVLYHSGLLSQLRRMTKLTVHLENPGDISILNKIITSSWFKASTKLLLKFQSVEIPDLVCCFANLNKILQRNGSLHSKLEIQLNIEAFLPSTIDALSQLILQTTKIYNVSLRPKPNDNIGPVVTLLNKAANLKRISLLNCNFTNPFRNPSSVVFSNASVLELSLAMMSLPSEIAFHGLPSLKRLYLFCCVLNLQAISSIPETLEVLSIDYVELTGTDINCNIQLPL
ncbi:unnamed protein product [Ambrosiozyma monospora]|uniref:Unnamed protein product n=1 Tax=Ambrosiozyma monospora TaxID=43982 RepID=A0ACB5STA9_AMBMO|nr:unnamed protein product [Ambrosiozyma monospora]